MAAMFTAQDRARIRQQLVWRAEADERIVAAAEVGGGASGQPDRWSDLDLTFGVDVNTEISIVLNDWTEELTRNSDAIHPFDLSFLTTIYRVFLFPGNLQVDLSFTPVLDFGSLGSNFQLLFGHAVERARVPPESPRHIFGLAVHHAVRGRICIERGRLWQAEYWISALRDHALSLACLRRGLDQSHGRGFDQLPAETLEVFQDALIRSLTREELLRALAASVEGLFRESNDVVATSARLQPRLKELSAHDPLE
jgi:hypothetical protein